MVALFIAWSLLLCVDNVKFLLVATIACFVKTFLCACHMRVRSVSSLLNRCFAVAAGKELIRVDEAHEDSVKHISL